jgi:hypothetical protein
MKKLILGATIAAATLIGGAAIAQPYGYTYSRGGYDTRYNDYRYDRSGDDRYGNYRYDSRRYRDSDGDGVSDRAEWGRDRDRDGRPDQWDRYDNRRDWRHHRSRHHHYERWDRWDRW